MENGDWTGVDFKGDVGVLEERNIAKVKEIRERGSCADDSRNLCI